MLMTLFPISSLPSHINFSLWAGPLPWAYKHAIIFLFLKKVFNPMCLLQVPASFLWTTLYNKLLESSPHPISLLPLSLDILRLRFPLHRSIQTALVNNTNDFDDTNGQIQWSFLSPKFICPSVVSDIKWTIETVFWLPAVHSSLLQSHLLVPSQLRHL